MIDLAANPSLTIAGIMAGVVVASVLGSAHCAGMCGPIMLFAIGSLDSAERPTSKRRIHLAYHLGRALSYTALGASAGAAGAAIDLGGGFVGLQRAAGIVFGAMMLAMGIGLIASHFGTRLSLPRLPGRHQRLVESLHRGAMRLPAARRAWAVGLLTPLLPCGWLYLYVLAAAGTASPLVGGAVLLAFWAGTVPMLAGVGAGLEALSAPLRKRLPLVSGLVVVVIGLMSIAGRLSMPSFSSDEQRAILVSHTHGFTLPDQTPPCCNEEAADASEPSP